MVYVYEVPKVQYAVSMIQGSNPQQSVRHSLKIVHAQAGRPR